MRYDSIAAIRGARNRKQGEVFEEYIVRACELYRDRSIAFIEKTPEPFKVTGTLGSGKFVGHFQKAAQPDFKGTVLGGGSIVFDAKSTSTDKIKLSCLTTEQAEALTLHGLLGAEAYVLCGWNFRDFAMIPFHVFKNAGTLNGHLYWTAEEAKQHGYDVKIKNGYIDFLEGVIESV